MAPTTSSIEFIEATLSCTTPFQLSYADPKQKWLIRKHLLSLIQDYPTFTFSTDTFTHNDGTTMNLLYTTADLHISNHTPPVPIIIWLHENYPYRPPLVFVSSISPIHRHHPFVDLSGATTSPYLESWIFPRCNLRDLVHNLVKIFAIDHPFSYVPGANFAHPSFVSKMEAIDRLSGMLHYDIIALHEKNLEEMEGLSRLQEEMVKRVDIATSMIIGLEHERINLKNRVMDCMNQADVLMNWLRVNHLSLLDDHEMEDAFEGVDQESNMVIDCLASDKALEDLIYALDKALEEGVVSLDQYIKQVRILAREEFTNRAMLVKLRGPNILHCHY